MLRRFSVNDTHLYPGALLQALDPFDEAQLSPGDELLLEFSDGVLACGKVQEIEPGLIVLQVPAYRTQRGTVVAARHRVLRFPWRRQSGFPACPQ